MSLVQVNKPLRADEEVDKELVTTICKALDELPPFHGTVYSGADLYYPESDSPWLDIEELRKEGAVFSDEAFLSMPWKDFNEKYKFKVCTVHFRIASKTGRKIHDFATK